MAPLVRLEKAPPLGLPLTLVQGPAQISAPPPLAPPPLVFMAAPAVAPPLQRKPSFDPSLMFLQSAAAVGGWLGGRRGLLASRGGVALPYLPPFGSSLAALAVLLRAKSSLTKAALRLFRQGLEPRRSRSKPPGPSSTPGQRPEPSAGRRSFSSLWKLILSTRARLQRARVTVLELPPFCLCRFLHPP